MRFEDEIAKVAYPHCFNSLKIAFYTPKNEDCLDRGTEMRGCSNRLQNRFGAYSKLRRYPDGFRETFEEIQPYIYKTENSNQSTDQTTVAPQRSLEPIIAQSSLEKVCVLFCIKRRVDGTKKEHFFPCLKIVGISMRVKKGSRIK